MTTIECRTGQRTGLLDLAAELYRAEYQRHRTPVAWARGVGLDLRDGVMLVAWRLDGPAFVGSVQTVWVRRYGGDTPSYIWESGSLTTWPRGWAWVPWSVSATVVRDVAQPGSAPGS